MRAVDGTTFTIATTTTTATFPLAGGQYFGDVVLAGGGTVTLKKLGSDALTYIGIAGASASATTTFIVNLGRGTYRFEGASAGTSFCSIVRIPGE